ncbi:hypothetical protein CEXT_460961 [Caerostris extrusa]|uniref:Uncharacterized protein n=1 Tax=Caerostris extrusa TaxID=172846 RepID=A0AAV4MWH4_CAEEX|nr:hypothetical protein CEXT_460961 [Caerostris extrusa]
MPKIPKPVTNTNQPKTFTSTFSNPKVSYASLLTPPQPQISTPEISSPLNTIKDIIMDPEILQLLSALHKVLPSIKECKDPISKMFLLVQAASSALNTN